MRKILVALLLTLTLLAGGGAGVGRFKQIRFALFLAALLLLPGCGAPVPGEQPLPKMLRPSGNTAARVTS